MKSCNTKKREPEKKIFKLIKKKPTVAEEFFPNLQAIGDPFFLVQCTILCAQGPSTHPQCSSVTEMFFGKERHKHKGKGCWFLWQILLASRKASSPEKAPQLNSFSSFASLLFLCFNPLNMVTFHTSFLKSFLCKYFFSLFLCKF